MHLDNLDYIQYTKFIYDIGVFMCVCMHTYATCNHCPLGFRGRIKGAGYTTTGIIRTEETPIR